MCVYTQKQLQKNFFCEEERQFELRFRLMKTFREVRKAFQKT